MRLNYWTSGKIERIYLQGMPGTLGKTYAQVSRGRVQVVAEEFTEEPALVLAALADYAGLPASTPGAALFSALKALAANPKATGRATTSQPAHALPQPELVRYGMVDLNFANIDNSQPVEVEVDHREPEGIDALIAQAPNTRVTRGHLSVADYRINGGAVLVERKTVTDFAQSVQDGRLFDQAQRIGFEPGTTGIVILEGDVFRQETGMLLSAITGAISCLSMVQGLSVINTLDLRHSAFVVAKLSSHQRNGLGYDLPSRKDKPKQLLDATRYVLEGINGVNPALAEALLRHFGSIRAVAAAEEAELLKVKGIGPKTAAKIFETLAKPYGKG